MDIVNINLPASYCLTAAEAEAALAGWEVRAPTLHHACGLPNSPGSWECLWGAPCPRLNAVCLQGMPAHASSCQLMPAHASSCHLMPPHASSCQLMPPHATSCHLMAPHGTSCHLMPAHATSCHLMPAHATSCHLTHATRRREAGTRGLSYACLLGICPPCARLASSLAP